MGAARRPAAQPATDLIWLRPDSGARDQRPALSRDQIVRAAIELDYDRFSVPAQQPGRLDVE